MTQAVPLEDDFRFACACGCESFDNLQTVLTSCAVVTWGFKDGKLLSVSNGECGMHWDSAEDYGPQPYECTRCHTRYSETELFALLTPDDLATLTKAKLTT